MKALKVILFTFVGFLYWIFLFYIVVYVPIPFPVAEPGRHSIATDFISRDRGIYAEHYSISGSKKDGFTDANIYDITYLGGKVENLFFVDEGEKRTLYYIASDFTNKKGPINRFLHIGNYEYLEYRYWKIISPDYNVNRKRVNNQNYCEIDYTYYHWNKISDVPSKYDQKIFKRLDRQLSNKALQKE